MKVKVELTISRTTGGRDETPMCIRISDATSGCRMLEANFRLEDFMEILTGRAGISGEGEYWPDVPVGCTQETKEEVVPKPKNYKESPEDDKILKSYEINGWVARRSDLHNHHRWAGEGRVRVTFSRFIRPDGGVWGVS